MIEPLFKELICQAINDLPDSHAALGVLTKIEFCPSMRLFCTAEGKPSLVYDFDGDGWRVWPTRKIKAAPGVATEL